MRSLRALAPVSLLFTAAALSACGPAGPAEQATDCPTSFPNDFPETRAVELGEGAPGNFKPYADGDTVTLIKGNQGLFMVTPSVRVEAKDGDGDDACFRVNLDSKIGGGDVGLQTNVHFVKDGGSFVSDGALYNPLGNEPEKLAGQHLTLTAVVRGEGFEGTRSHDLTLK